MVQNNYTEVFDFESAEFLRDFALHNGYPFQINVGRQAYKDCFGKPHTRRCYEVNIYCSKAHFERILEEV